MKPWALGLLLGVCVPGRAQLVVGVPRLSAAPAPVAPGAAPVLAAPAGFAAPSLSAPALSAAPVLSAAPALAAAPAALTAAAPALPVAALAPAPAAAPHAGAEAPAPESQAQDAGRIFDGAVAARGSFEGDGGLPVVFKRRAGPSGVSPRVYAGGLALNESFDPLFARAAAPARAEYFVWTRGHRPTGWTATNAPIDADARDLARMIVLAARETGEKKVELALHSFGTLVFQRLLQLRAEPEVRAALKLLAGSRVVLLNATTHYAGSEKRAGRQFEQMGQATRQFVDMLNAMDQAAANWAAMAGLNPFMGPAVELWMAEYRSQRGQLLAMASQGATNMMKKDLKEPWDPAFDSIRRDFVAALAEDSKDHGWQEALLRRSSDMFRLEFSRRDVDFLRRLKIRVDLIHASGDQLLNWESARTLFERLGIPAPAAAPAPGTVLSDATGRLRAAVVEGDHYYPLKRRDDLAKRLDP